MPSDSPTPASEPTLASGLRAGLRLVPMVGVLAATTCALFALCGGLFIGVYLKSIGHEDEPGFYVRLAVKTAGFGAMSLAGIWLLARLARSFPPRLSDRALLPSEDGRFAWLLVVVCAYAFVVVPALDRYPAVQPDEFHHLIVARNIAEFGEYASGHPDAGYVHFDSYDSVGPAVLFPVAASMRLMEDDLVATRLVMAGSFLAFLLGLCVLMRPVFGGRAALAGTVLAGSAIGSVYLGRTLYGEVPALMFAVAGLIYWRSSLLRDRHLVWSVLAGTCFGLSVLSKSFMVLAVFPFLGVCLLDRFTYRRIRLSRILIPGATLSALVGGWIVYTALAAPEGSESGSVIALYRHYLLFGVGSTPRAIEWFWAHPLLTLGLAAGAVSSLPLFLLFRYDPPALVLYLLGILYIFWWACFTPATIPRYLWYSLALGGMFTGPLAMGAIGMMRDEARSGMQRSVACAVLIVLAVPSVDEVWYEIVRVDSADELSDEVLLMNFLQTKAGAGDVATTSWMAQRSANFLAGRHLPLITEDEISGRAGCVVRDRQLEGERAYGAHTSFGSGRYLLVFPQGGLSPTRDDGFSEGVDGSR